MADQHHTAALEPGKSAHYRLVIGIIAVTAQRHEFVKGVLDKITEMRALRMAGHLRLLPRRKRGIGAGQQIGALGLQSSQLGADIDFIAF